MKGSIGPKIGLVLSRVIVPGWVLTGALFKLTEATPKNLPPKTILVLADKVGIDLYVLLATLVGLEFLAVAVMLLVARLARPMAMFMLSVFCVVLIGEMVQGNVTSCGCLGKVDMPPWLMLAIDGTLLLAVMAFDPSPIYPPSSPRWPIFAALVLTAAGFGWSFTAILRAGQAPPPNVAQPNVGSNGNVQPAGSDPTVNPTPAPLPAYWFSSDLSGWVGKPWREVDLLKYMRTWPRGLDRGTRYVIFYNRTCDHCEDMFHQDLSDPDLARKVTAVEVPDSKEVMTSPYAWTMPVTEVEQLNLPLGCEWIITTPLAITIVDGVVTCAVEGDHKECMGLE